jgi:hypothetical protein
MDSAASGHPSIRDNQLHSKTFRIQGMNHRKISMTLLQATQESPVLARLTDLTRESNARLQAIEPLIPQGIRSAVTAGPIEGSVWCVILDNNSVAAKFRQLLPSLEAHLRNKGFDVQTIRIKVHKPGQTTY